MQAKQIFEILVRENASMLTAYLRTMIRDASAVDDLFQETMLIAWRRLDDFERDRSFGPWLRGIAGKLVLAYYRKTARQAVPIDQSTLVWLESQFQPIEQSQGDSFGDKLRSLRDCVDSLPLAYQRPIQLRYQQGLGLNDIVESLSIAMATLKKRLSRGKQRLANCLEKKRLAMENPS